MTLDLEDNIETALEALRQDNSTDSQLALREIIRPIANKYELRSNEANLIDLLIGYHQTYLDIFHENASPSFQQLNLQHLSRWGNALKACLLVLAE